LGYGEVASDAAGQPVPNNVKLKDPSQFKLIGTSAKRIDTPAKVNGTAVFGIDIRLPGMRIGTVAISPVKGGKLVSMDEAAARRVPGVHDVIRGGDEAVAVIGDHMWAGIKGLEALRPVWDGGPNGGVTTASLIASMDQASRQTGVIATNKADAAAAINGAATKLSAVYQLPFLSHSPMEPLNCTLHIQGSRRNVGGHAGAGARAKFRDGGDRTAGRQGDRQQPADGRRVRTAAGHRQHRRRRGDRQTGELPGQAGVDARRGYASRLLSPLLL
jgi:CO/xanthine dehydrogenase Mo-binding subunit